MARQRVRPSEGEIVNWFSRFWKAAPATPEIEGVRRKRNRFEVIGAPPPDAAPPPPVKPPPPPEPVELPPAEPPLGQRPRRLMIRAGQLWEVCENGIYLAHDDGFAEEDILTRWKRLWNAEINFE